MRISHLTASQPDRSCPATLGTAAQRAFGYSSFRCDKGTMKIITNLRTVCRHRHHWCLAALAAGIIIAGGLLRANDLGGASLWLDEAVIWDIGQGSLGDILSANATFNSAPPAYPVFVRVVSDLWGNSEAQLRSFSLVLGIAGLLTIWLLARRWLSWPGALLTLSLMAFSPEQVYYSRELREYSLATLLAIVLFYCAERVLANGSRWTTVGVYTLIACAAPFTQFGLAILAASVHLVYLLHTLRNKSRTTVMLFSLSSACLGVAMITVYVLFLQGRVRNNDLSFWYLEANYLSAYTAKAAILHLWSNTIGLFDMIFTTRPSIVFLLLVLVGIGEFWSSSSRRYAILLMVTPLVIVAGFSMVRLYPYGGVRQDIFLLPMLYLVAAAGLERLLRATAKPRLLGAAIFVLLLYWPLTAIGPGYSYINDREPLRPLVQYLGNTAAPGDVVYVYSGARPAFRYYWEGRGLGDASEDVRIVMGSSRRQDPAGYLPEVEQAFGQGQRLWLVFSHVYDQNLSEEKLIIDGLRTYYSQAEMRLYNRTVSGNLFSDTALYLFTR